MRLWFHLLRHVSFVATLSLALAGCTTDDGNSNNGGDPAGGDPHQPGDGVEAPDAFNGDFGPLDDFPIRVPGTHPLTCSGASTSADFVDVDYRCRVDYGTLHADLYLQATPTACQQFMSAVPTAYSVAAFAKVDGEDNVRQISGGYEWGGNHHNDFIGFAIDGKAYDIWHSCTGSGFRACAPPDCLRPCNTGVTFDACNYAGGFSSDGCARAIGAGPPPSPAICVRVTADGSVPPLLDPWTAQTGYPSYPLLPCAGDQGSPP